MQADSPESGKSPKKNSLYAAFTGGLELAVSLCLGVYGGQALDAKFTTKPLFLLLGVAAGFSVGLYLLIRSAKMPPPNRPKRD
ncbi:MAG: hypothetical protein COB53_11950 [Elusimicrobia bacterium]|nr:MAG: hypothetical protein COB53_11950 [Elusimicrobiota bacterium]